MSQVRRKAWDGPVKVKVTEHEQVQIQVGHKGVTQSLTLSEFNARRMVAALCVVLDLPLRLCPSKNIKREG